VAALFAANGWSAPKGRELPPLGPNAVEVVAAVRRALGLPPGVALDKRWLRRPCNLVGCLRILVLANRRLQAMNEVAAAAGPAVEQEDDDRDELLVVNAEPDERAPVEHRLITLAPVCTLRSHFVTLDTSCLFGLMKEAGLLPEGTSAAAFLVFGKEHWSSVFKVDRMRGKQRWTFTGTIDTDGTAMCAHFHEDHNETMGPPIASRQTPDAGRTNDAWAFRATRGAGRRPRPVSCVIQC
jgi:hypothetical protein